jgi:hypothetical protein
MADTGQVELGALAGEASQRPPATSRPPRGYAAATIGNLGGIVVCGFLAYGLLLAFPSLLRMDLGLDPSAAMANLAVAVFATFLVIGLVVVAVAAIGGAMGCALALRLRHHQATTRTALVLVPLQLAAAALVAMGLPVLVLFVTPLLARRLVLLRPFARS